MSNFGDEYSDIYNMLYEDKPYEAEVDYIESLIRRNSSKTTNYILDLGCGTGVHANYLSSKYSYDVIGVDLSKAMLERARKLEHESLKFFEGDAKKFSSDYKFDVVTSLFHVASYQTSNKDFEMFIDNAYKNLNSSGLFIFDFWYGPGVLTDLPQERTKNIENEVFSLTRETTPAIDFENNLVTVNFRNFLLNKNEDISREFLEEHKMRYFFKKEIEKYIQGKFSFCEMHDWLKFENSERSWFKVVVLKKNEEM